MPRVQNPVLSGYYLSVNMSFLATNYSENYNSPQISIKKISKEVMNF